MRMTNNQKVDGRCGQTSTSDKLRQKASNHRVLGLRHGVVSLQNQVARERTTGDQGPVHYPLHHAGNKLAKAIRTHRQVIFIQEEVRANAVAHCCGDDNLVIEVKRTTDQ